MGWRPPKPDGFQLNSDGALRCNSTQTAAGGLIRDHHGNRVAGYCRNIGAATCLTLVTLKEVEFTDTEHRKAAQEIYYAVRVRLTTLSNLSRMPLAFLFALEVPFRAS